MGTCHSPTVDLAVDLAAVTAALATVDPAPLRLVLFLHDAFDVWMRRTHPANAFERSADDAICHCRREKESQRLLDEHWERFASCDLQLHPEKPQVVDCRDGNCGDSLSCDRVEFARTLNPILRGWIQYCGGFYKTEPISKL